MKKKIIIILILATSVFTGALFLLKCKQEQRRESKRIQQEIINRIKITDMFDHNLTKEAERLDHKSILKADPYINYTEVYYNLTDKSRDYYKRYPDGTYLRIDCRDGFIFCLELTPPDSYFTLTKYYHPNGVLSSKGYRFHNGGFSKGIWYRYNEIGLLKEEEDFDKLKKFTFEQVLAFCKDRKISVNKGYSESESRHSDTFINYSDISNIWGIDYFDTGISRFKGIVMNGNTGEVLYEEEGMRW